MLEAILIRAFLMLYSRDFEGDDNEHRPDKCGKTRDSESRAFALLSSVCWPWQQTLDGWPESPTRHWLRHELKRRIEREFA